MDLLPLLVHLGLCRQQQKKLVAAMEKAWDHGMWEGGSYYGELHNLL